MHTENAPHPLADKAALPDRIEAFTFGEPVPMLDRREILDYIECARLGKWYEPPVSFHDLTRTFRSSPHHASAIYVKRNILASTFRPHRMLDRETFSSFALDYLLLGNGFLERKDAISGRPLRLVRALGKYMRRGVDMTSYYFIQNFTEHAFAAGTVFHLQEPDVNQEVYGLPEYLSALQGVLLNEASTLYRRKYYLNGSHAGYILYLSDATQSSEDIDAIRDALRSAKGPGNFRNLFIYAPNGKEKGVQVIPISDVAAKDEFMNIKSVSRDDILAAHRVPPQLLGIMPTNTGGFGPVKDAAQVFVTNELEPLQFRFLALNDWIGEDVIRFDPYGISATVAAK